MFNKTYQLRAVRQAGGGHKVSEDALLRLPWAGIFEPWRPFVAVAAASRKSRRRPLVVSPQLELFPDIGAQKFTGVEIPDTPVKNSPAKSDRPLFDIFPEAYQ
jgi:hypothetical protein